MTKSEVKESRQRRHLVIGRYLAIRAWRSGLDCIVLMRDHLKTFLGRENIWPEHIEAFTLDIKDWFPYPQAYYLAKGKRPINSLFLSRAPIIPYLPTDSMPTNELINKVNKVTGAPKPGRFSKFDDAREIPSQVDMIWYLEGLASGLKTTRQLQKQKQ